MPIASLNWCWSCLKMYFRDELLPPPSQTINIDVASGYRCLPIRFQYQRKLSQANSVVSSSSGSPAVRTPDKQSIFLQLRIPIQLFLRPAPSRRIRLAAGSAARLRSRDEVQLGDTTFDGFLRAAKHFCNISGAPIASLPSFTGSESSKVFLRKGRSEYSQQLLSIGICLKCQRHHPWPRVLVEVTLILVDKHNLFREIIRH